MAGRLKLPFSYRAGKTILHRSPAIIKLLCVIVLSAAAGAFVPGLVISILVMLTASIAAHILPWELLKGSRVIIVLSLFIVFFKTFEQGALGITTPEIIIGNFYIPDIYIPNISTDGFFDGIITALRILVTFAAAALLFSVTTMRELRLSIMALEKIPGVKKTAVVFFSLGISLMLGFIPRFFDLWETANIACEARSCRRGLRRLFILVPLVTGRMMETAADTAVALESRAAGIVIDGE
jgi:biotin transport system permease protein